MTAICIIPARSGSQRIPKKNIRDFLGQPIIAYSIVAAQNSGLFERVIVSTDSQEIADVAAHYEAEVSLRPYALCYDRIGTQEVMAHEARLWDAATFCCLYATSPLMSIDDLCRSFRECMENDHGGFAFSVNVAPLFDAGQFYFGRKRSFITMAPLISPDTVMVPIAPERVCDINIEKDWKRAEEMYLALHPSTV